MKQMKLGLGGLALVLAIGILGLTVGRNIAAPTRYAGTFLSEGLETRNFALAGPDGETVRLADFEGRITLLFFGFTHCPDICPLTLTRLARAMDLLDGDAEDVQVLMITVDPDRDTPERLQRYVTGFDPSFMGLTGSRTSVREVAAVFGIYNEKADGPADGAGHDSGHDAAAAGPDDDYTVNHTSHVLAIDRDGLLRLLWSPEVTPEEIAADLERLLAL